MTVRGYPGCWISCACCAAHILPKSKDLYIITRIMLRNDPRGILNTKCRFRISYTHNSVINMYSNSLAPKGALLWTGVMLTFLFSKLYMILHNSFWADHMNKMADIISRILAILLQMYSFVRALSSWFSQTVVVYSCYFSQEMTKVSLFPGYKKFHDFFCI